MRRVGIIIVAAALICPSAGAGDTSWPVGEPVLERPTLRSLGAYWLVGGDDDADASVAVEYRKAGGGTWRAGPPLFRVEKGRHVDGKYGGGVDLPEGARLFAGSVLMLEPDTAYELRLTVWDPDGGEAVRLLKARTRAEPVAPADARVRHVVPGEGGGSGTQRDPFRGLAGAIRAARPGDVLLLGDGTYVGAVEVSRSGEVGRPIIVRGQSRRGVILDGQTAGNRRPQYVLNASGRRDLWFENPTVRNGKYAIVAHDSARLVVRGCVIDGVDFGFTCTRNTGRDVEDHFIADNLIEGPSTWPRTRGTEDARGVQVTGAGHVVAYNRIRNFGDAIDTFDSARVEAIDIHNNDLSELTDDGIELDYSRRNVRCFENRLTNVFQGISVQPVYGGPAYVVRNVMFNVAVEPFKIHNGPSGALFVHNTVVKKGPPMLVYTPQPASNLFMRNNLFVGTSSGDGTPLPGYLWECQPKMRGCDFDYDGFSGGPFKMALRWNGGRYRTFEEVIAKAPIERNGRMIQARGLFASGAAPPADLGERHPAADLRLAPGSGAVDAGQPMSGLNEGFGGVGPDLGAHESGAPMPQYGPRDSKAAQ